MVPCHVALPPSSKSDIIWLTQLVNFHSEGLFCPATCTTSCSLLPIVGSIPASVLRSYTWPKKRPERRGALQVQNGFAQYGDGPFTPRLMAIWSGTHLSEYLRLSRKNAKPTKMAWNLRVSTAQLVWRFIPSSAEGLGPGFQEDGGRFRKAWAYEIKYLTAHLSTRYSESIWTYVNSDGNRLPGKIYTLYGGLKVALCWWNHPFLTKFGASLEVAPLW